MPFNVNKCHILPVVTRYEKTDYEMNGVKLDSVQRVSIASNVKFSRQCKDAAFKANRMVGFINRKFSFKNKDIILPLYLVRSHMEHVVLFWSHSYKGHSKIRSCSAKGDEDDNMTTS